MLDRVTWILRVYTRAFLAQGVGVVGLAWCLAQNLPAVACGLTGLVLIDQAIFLRGRPALIGTGRAMQKGLDIWCLSVSGLDVLLLLATLFRSAGLYDLAHAPVSDPLSCLAFALATVARLDLGLVPGGGAGRLLAAVAALLGDIALLFVFAAILRALLRRSELSRS